MKAIWRVHTCVRARRTGYVENILTEGNPERPPALPIPLCDFLRPQRTDQFSYRLMRHSQLLLEFGSGFEAKKSLLEH